METSIQYPCPICNSENGLRLNVHTSEIAYFGEHTEMTLICNDCGWRHTDFIPSEGKKPSVCSLVIDSSELMTTRVVRSSSCTVRIVELGLEVEPGDNATGYISNVEGVLGRFSDAISVILRSAMQDGDEGEEQVKACQELIERIGRVKKGEESVKLLLLDPNGHSQILHESATSSELSEEEIAALAIGPQIPIFDSSDFGD
ncbi:MAG: ZPR1 zinc finger domain-containing protein [Candidatus Poseidoniales archaeon]|nr:ZPR1 zinc finger domain-containing protein [Candidatus Poseidoniales archaeon]MEC9351265.1 ZPR1 zinc finger domain-containing protein [Candidatus Thermoplasmatota archaeon]